MIHDGRNHIIAGAKVAQVNDFIRRHFIFHGSVLNIVGDNFLGDPSFKKLDEFGQTR